MTRRLGKITSTGSAPTNKVLRRINELIKQCLRTLSEGIGKPEPLKHELSGYWSRRITDEHRMVYKVVNGKLYIAQLRYHYYE